MNSVVKTTSDEQNLQDVMSGIRSVARDAVGRPVHPVVRSAYEETDYTSGQASSTAQRTHHTASLDLPEGAISLTVPIDLSKASRGKVKLWLDLMLKLAETD